MNVIWRRLFIWAVLGFALAAGLVYAFWPRPVPVDLLAASRGALTVVVGDEGETRVRDVFVLSAPVAGRLLRIDRDVGDAVTADMTVVARIQPVDPAFLDLRSEAEARAAVRAAEAAEILAEAELDKALAELEFAETEVERARRLVQRKTISERALDDAERIFRTSKATVETAKAALEVRRFELQAARAILVSPVDARAVEECACVNVTAPVTGRVLRLLRESEGVVQAGEALVEIGDPRDLEIVADLLSTDAVKVEPGQAVVIEGWGGEPLNGAVNRVEPYGFTKVSALGIDEQRVNVIVDFTDPAERWQRLGHGYRVEIRVVLWQGEDVLKVPLSALFRDGQEWAVFVERDGRARLRRVTLGQRTDLEAQILDGIDEGDPVVVHPGIRVEDGVLITARR